MITCRGCKEELIKVESKNKVFSSYYRCPSPPMKCNYGEVYMLPRDFKGREYYESPFIGVWECVYLLLAVGVSIGVAVGLVYSKYVILSSFQP